ncbi:MAG: hypothetical protein RSF82_11930 [Angelakisella sp.]
MSTINIGKKEILINDRAILRFNPSDPTIYERFCELCGELEAAGEKIIAKREEYANNTETDRWGVPIKRHKIAQLMVELDTQIKEKLRYVFGASNDFEDIFEGVNVFAGTDTGEWVITNFLNAIRPEIEASTEQRMKAKANAAQMNRQQRRAGHKQ